MKTLLKMLALSDRQLLTAMNAVTREWPGEHHFDENNYLYIHNQHPVCLLAHVDTVTIKAVVPKVRGTVITNGMNDPLGGDDRCGVWAILRICEHLMKLKLPLPSIIFTAGEERGGVGMKVFLKDAKYKPEGVRLLVALDRKGCNDWVDYITVPKEVKQYVESFGYIQSNGSYSDVKDLSYETLIPGVNLSVGYYSQHTNAERIHFDELQLTVRRVIQMCKEPIAELYPVTRPVYKYRGNYANGYGDYDDFGAYRTKKKRKIKRTGGALVPLTGVVATTWEYCSWCKDLYKKIELDETTGLCKTCLDTLSEANAVVAELPPDSKIDAATVITIREMIDGAIERVTNWNFYCKTCLNDYQQCTCGDVYREIETAISMLLPDEQDIAWKMLCDDLRGSSKLMAKIKESGHYHD